MSSARHRLEQLLDQAGIEINGKHPWDIAVHDGRLYSRILAGGSF